MPERQPAALRARFETHSKLEIPAQVGRAINPGRTGIISPTLLQEPRDARVYLLPDRLDSLIGRFALAHDTIKGPGLITVVIDSSVQSAAVVPNDEIAG